MSDIDVTQFSGFALVSYPEDFQVTEVAGFVLVGAKLPDEEGPNIEPIEVADVAGFILTPMDPSLNVNVGAIAGFVLMSKYPTPVLTDPQNYLQTRIY